MDVPASLISALPLSPDACLILDTLTEQQVVSWASKQILGRLRNLGLIEEIGTGYRTTSLGSRVRTVGEAHLLKTGRKRLGRATFAGSRVLYGVIASCSCGDWRDSFTELGRPAVRMMEESHAKHVLAQLSVVA